VERLVLDDDDEEDRMQIVITDPRVFNARGQKILNKDGSRGGSIGDSNLIGKERFRPTDWLRQSPEKIECANQVVVCHSAIRAQPKPAPGAYGHGASGV
jgi:hypothetical protein